ncbi:hypothetical protein BCR41DRAFT_346810 [Lobosporangium transversale]|uniref:Uncharacterized protein n=1 Tax=Lobosporangium transversale TaxID=64571 RepID=A0A1Y2GYT2_9FUNG|nr:hypothetical protein BCR41DRAFT_346810 [Lobosporangium transversale]ORZ27458.1 hypothetical protein BCR41DRAFT_346810 [Lobosporangium transversale]|eukprot:XP_021885185.1 hypothetical protein BCR41DRAFT_346810 [Lobosporangium transversale]
MTPVSSSRLDGLAEVTELEQIPLPYKVLYHTLILKNEMPIDLLQERQLSGSQQLLTWIKAAMSLLETVSASHQPPSQQQKSSQPQSLQQLFQRDEEEDEELEAEIQDVVSGFGQYESTIESSIEILLQLEEAISERSSTPLPKDDDGSQAHLSPEIETVLSEWSRFRGIVNDLSGSIREHQRLRDGIQSVRNMTEQTQMATGILEKCLRDIAADRQRTAELALQDINSWNESSTSLNSQDSASSLRARATTSGVDSNDMLELDSRMGLLALQIDTLQKSYPECTRSSKLFKSRAGRNLKQQEGGSIAEKKYVMHKLYRELLKDWHAFRTRKDQLWRDLEECDRWRTRIEKMAKQIESMLEPVEIFHKMCVNILTTLDAQATAEDEMDDTMLRKSLTVDMLDIAEAHVELSASSASSASSAPTHNKSFMDPEEPVDMEMLSSVLQELDEKQNMTAPAIENMFWVQEGEIQHRSKAATVPSTTPTPTSETPVDAPQLSPASNSTASSPTPPTMDHSPLYPSLAMLERQRNLKNRWSNLKTSLDTIGTKLHAHHIRLKEKANVALIKKEEAAEDKTLVGSGNSDWGSAPRLRRSNTVSTQQTLPTRPISPNWKPSHHRFLRGKLVTSMSMDSSAVRKYMLVKSDKPVWDKPRPWCPSANPQSPGMPGFPLQTSSWGYYIVTTSKSEENFGALIATPAPPPVRAPTPKPPPPPKFNRPPFSPGGNRRYTAFNKPPPPPPSRSLSVTGDYKNNPYLTASGDTIDWAKTLRRSTSVTNIKPINPRGRNTPASRQKRAVSAAAGTIQGQGIGSNSNKNRSSLQLSSGAWDSKHNNGTNNNGSRRHSLSSFNNPLMMQNNDSTSSVDSTDSSSSTSSLASIYSALYDGGRTSSNNGNNNNNYGSSLSSSIGGRSPSPYEPMFGSSFTAARSSAALHSALMASMSSSSSASLRYCSSSLSNHSGNNSSNSNNDDDFSSSKFQQHLQKQQQEYRQRQRQRQHKEQMKKLGTTSASSWMSMNMNLNTGSILSALSFTVPTYNFEDEFGPLGQRKDSITAM